MRFNCIEDLELIDESVAAAGVEPRQAEAGIIEPEEGAVLGVTTAERPFLTLDINLEAAHRAKNSYPRYVLD